jgi:hypothetical protein
MKMKRALILLVALALCAPAYADRVPTSPSYYKYLKKRAAVACFIARFYGKQCKPI